MSTFVGTELPADVAARLQTAPPAGFTLFHDDNVTGAVQVRALTAALQNAARTDARPLLIATDQEGGQLVALGAETTQFAGAMAIGAAGDQDLAERVARATARELLALGVNVNYAPVCDLATNPGNPALGLRTFGDDPHTVASLVAATVRGLQAEGVAATAKHVPGVGDLTLDTHYELGAVGHDRQALEARELVPFRAALEAGARFVMSGHFALPSLTGDASLPATLAPEVMTRLLRDELGFDGLAITDALDMHALGQGAAQIVDVISAVRAGVDLLLCAHDPDAMDRIEAALRQAVLRRLVDDDAPARSAERLGTVRSWLAGFEQPGPEVVRCSEHGALALELAERSVTLVRNDARLLPLRPAANERILVVQPRPADLTPADTSSHVAPMLAHRIRSRHPGTEEVVVGSLPTADEIASVRAHALRFDIVILGTVAADRLPEQAALARSITADGGRCVTVALRTPWDVSAYPASDTHVCTFGILGPTMEATAAALFGDVPFRGRLPVEISGHHARGHGLTA